MPRKGTGRMVMLGKEAFSAEEGKPRAAAGLWGRSTGYSCRIQASFGQVGAAAGEGGAQKNSPEVEKDAAEGSRGGEGKPRDPVLALL